MQGDKNGTIDNDGSQRLQWPAKPSDLDSDQNENQGCKVQGRKTTSLKSRKTIASQTQVRDQNALG
jgi:hypothetical protein